MKTPALILSPRTGQPTFPILGTLSPAQGPVSGGTPVKIKGINFSTQPGATIVRFGNLAALKCHVLVDHRLRGRDAEVVDRRAGPGDRVVNGIKAVDDATPFTYHT